MRVTLFLEAFERLRKWLRHHTPPSSPPVAVSTGRVGGQLLHSDMLVRKKEYILRTSDNTTGLE